jgi:hypothetical protein
MPRWKLHLLFNSIVIFFWFNLLSSLNLISDHLVLITIIFLSYFLSIFPDIDHSESPIRRIFAGILALIVTINFFANSSLDTILLLPAFLVLVYIFLKFFPTKHRGLTHKLWFSIVFSFIMTVILGIVFNFSFVYFIIYFFCLLSGYLSHLVLDIF